MAEQDMVPPIEPHVAPPEHIPKPNSLPKTDVLQAKNVSALLKKNRGAIALGSIGLGVAKAVVDGDDDDLGSALGKGIKTGVLATGLSYGAEYMFKSETVQDMVRGEVSDATKSAIRQGDVGRFLKGGSRAANALHIGKYALAAATILDVAERASENHEAKVMKANEEYQFKQKQKEKKRKQKQMAYGNIDQGEILFDLFNQRSGHYKMGNAKFN